MTAKKRIIAIIGAFLIIFLSVELLISNLAIKGTAYTIPLGGVESQIRFCCAVRPSLP